MKDIQIVKWGVANVTINTYIRLHGNKRFPPFAFLVSQRVQKKQETFGFYLYDDLIVEEMEALKLVYSKNIEMIDRNLQKDRKEAKKGRLLPLLKKDSHDGISFQELWDSGYICAGTTKGRGGKTIAIKLTREKIEALKGLELRALPDMIVAFDDKSLLKFKTTVNVEKIIDCRNERKSL